MASPADLTTFDRSLMIDEYGGVVETQFAKASVIRNYVKIRPLRGTDTLVNRTMGKTSLQAINDSNAGLAPDPTKTPFGKVTVSVDTIVLARNKRNLLNELQTDFNALQELGNDHGKEIGKFFDQSFLIQCIKGAHAAAPTSVDSIGAGKNKILSASGDELDPTKFEAAIRGIVVSMAEEDIDRDELIVWVRPTQFDVLAKSDKLVNVQYSAGNGDYAGMRLGQVAGCRIVETARIPNAAISNHKLGASFNVSAGEAMCKAVIMHPKSLLAAEAIPLTSDIWYDKDRLSWFIDSYLSYSVAVNRPDVCGGVFAFGATF